MRSILGFAIGVAAVAATLATLYLLFFEVLPADSDGSDETAGWVFTGAIAVVAAVLWVVTIVILRRAAEEGTTSS